MLDKPQKNPPTTDRIWLSNYPEGVPHTIDDVEVVSLGAEFRKRVALYPHRPFATSFGCTLTYAQLAAAAESVASWLIAESVRPGDRIAIMMPNIMAYPAILYGALLARCTVVGINPLYTAKELESQLNDSGARILFVLENFANVATGAIRNTSVDKVVVAQLGSLLGPRGIVVNALAKWVKRIVPPNKLGQYVNLEEVLKKGRASPAVLEPALLDDIAFLQYTGGTTGVPKGAMLSHRNVATNVEQSVAWFAPMLNANSKPHVMVTALPLYHIFALQACLLSMTRLGGCCLLIANPRDIPTFIRTLKKSKFSLFCGLNTLFNALSNHPAFQGVDFSDVRFCNAGGMPTHAVVAERWRNITGARIIDGYGLSETSPVLTVNPWNLENPTGLIGFPVPSTDISIRDVEGKPVEMGQPGELCAKGPQIMIGYWQRPDETAKAMTHDGYFRTGDIAVMLPDGQFRIVDRLKDMILVSGFNVYPTEIEEALSSCPGVAESAVIGLPDDRTGEKVAAYIVKRDDSLTDTQVLEYCRTVLTPYKVPRVIAFVETLPKSTVGKILRRELRD